jgi:hypothetical protein
MPAPVWDDLNIFVDPDDFAVVAVLTLSGSSRNVKCIYDDPYMNALLGEYDWDGSKPRITAKETDLVGVTRTTPVFVNGKQYYSLTNPQQDGTGMAVLTLSEEG